MLGPETIAGEVAIDSLQEAASCPFGDCRRRISLVRTGSGLLHPLQCQAERYVQAADGQGVGMVRFPRLVPRDEASAQKLAKRTLTNLYNERPTWLQLAHGKLDEAVFAAYGWDVRMSDEDLLAVLLERNRGQAATR